MKRKSTKVLRITSGMVTFYCGCGNEKVLHPITYDKTTTEGTYGPEYEHCGACGAERTYPPDAPDIAKLIDIPIKRWPGACYGIAGAVQLYLGGNLRYGHWLGKVSKNCPVEGFKNGAPFQRHGWLELDNGSIIDPTRWVFEGTVPYIYQGTNDGNYDAGGNALREAMLQPCPDYDATASRSSLAVWKHSQLAHRYVMDEIFGGALGVTNPMAWWLANLPLPRLDVFARPIFLALIECGEAGRIPIDNRRLVLGDQ